MEMTLIDFLIVYLSVGAPFGAYRFIRSRKAHFAPAAIRTVIATLVWPVLVGRSDFLKRLWKTAHGTVLRTGGGTKLDSEIASARSFFEDRADLSGLNLRHFREIFDRYAGLSAAKLESEGPASSTHAELLKAAGLERNFTSERCVDRRYRTRIEFHLDRARADLLGELSKIITGDHRIEELEQKALKFARVLEDDFAQKRILRLFAGDRRANVSVDQRGEVLCDQGTIRNSHGNIGLMTVTPGTSTNSDALDRNPF